MRMLALPAELKLDVMDYLDPEVHSKLRLNM